MLLPPSGPSSSIAVIVGPASARPTLTSGPARVAVRTGSSSGDGGGRGLDGFAADAATLADPAVGIRVRLCGRPSRDQLQAGPRRRFGRPPGATPPARVLLPGHRRVTVAAQARQMSIAHA